MTEFVQTRAALLRKNAGSDLVVASFEERKKNINKEQIKVPDNAKCKEEVTSDIDREKEMKRLRFEVMKFGMSGLSKDKARKANLDLAISLGAKPLKNRRQNYKKMQERKKKEEKEKKEKEMMFPEFDKSQLMNKKKFISKKKVQHNQNRSILGSYGRVSKPGKK